MVLIKVPFKDISIFIKLALQVTDKKRAFLVLQYLCNRSQGLGNIEVGKSETLKHWLNIYCHFENYVIKHMKISPVC